jgi:hypothetical protein
MRENRTYGSEGGEAKAFPTPIAVRRIQRPQVSEGARNLRICRLLQRAATMLAPSLLRRGVDGRDEPGHDDRGSETQSTTDGPTANAISAKIFILISLTENQNYGIVTYRWTKGASHADGKRPFPPRMAKTKG